MSAARTLGTKEGQGRCGRPAQLQGRVSAGVPSGTPLSPAHWGPCLLSRPLCLLAAVWWSPSLTACRHHAWPHIRPQAVQPAEHGLELLKPCTQSFFLDLGCFSQVFAHSNGKLTNPSRESSRGRRMRQVTG